MFSLSQLPRRKLIKADSVIKRIMLTINELTITDDFIPFLLIILYANSPSIPKVF